jgi:hypothetical protein
MHLKNKLNNKNLLNFVKLKKKNNIIKKFKTGGKLKKIKGFIHTNIFFVVNTVLENSNKLVNNFFIWDFCLIFIVFLIFILIFVNGYKKEPDSVKKIYFKILTFFSIWVILFDILSSKYSLSIITIGIIQFINVICIFLLATLYVKPQKNQIALVVDYYESINPILKQKALYVLAQDFIILFHKQKKVYNFNIEVNNKIIKYYPYYISPTIYNDFILVAYVKKLDITDLNVRYIITTPNRKKIINFNNILNYLMTILQKDLKSQEQFLTNLMKTILKLNNNQKFLNQIFSIESFFMFIHENHHFIPQLIKFCKINSIEKMANCQIQKNQNLHKINVLVCLKQVYTFLVKNSYLVNNKKNLKNDLYIFFSKYRSFKKLNLFTLENKQTEDIFILFMHCALNESSLDLKKFTSDFIMVFKK